MSPATGPESERATDDEPGFRFVAPAGRPTVVSRRARDAAAAVGVPLRLDREAALQLIADDAYPIDRAFFEGVDVIAPRVTITCGADGRLAFAEAAPPPRRTVAEAEAARLLRAAIDGAVERACARGSRIAVALSGGLDSGAVAVAADAAFRRLGRPREALVLYHMRPRAEPTEVDHARAIAAALGRSLLELPAPEGDPFEGVEELAAAADFPFDGSGAPAGLAAFRRLVAEGVEGVLTGDGGDEAVGPIGPFAIDATQTAGESLTFGLRARLRPAWHRFAPRWLVERHRGRPTWLSNRLRGVDPMPTSPPPRPGLEGASAARDRALRSSRQCVIVGWHRALERVTGLPTSIPFLDPAVEDLVVSLPPEHFAPGGRPKGLLRRAFEGTLPAAELARPKDQPDVEPIVREDFRRYGDRWAERFLRADALGRHDLSPREQAGSVIRAARAGSVRDLYRALSLIWISIWIEANGLSTPDRSAATVS